jgi:phytoene synthase
LERRSITSQPRAPAVQDDLDALVRRVDPDRWLSSRFIADADKRADVIALYAFDHELARASKVASNALIAEIRLTWWREALDEIYGGKVVRAHPAARALDLAVRRRALERALLEDMIDARIEALDPDQTAEARRRAGGSTAVAAATILGDPKRAEAARLAGEVWAGERNLIAAAADARRLEPAAFPAVAHVTLARSRQAVSKLGARLRLLWAVLTGRI